MLFHFSGLFLRCHDAVSQTERLILAHEDDDELLSHADTGCGNASEQQRVRCCLACCNRLSTLWSQISQAIAEWWARQLKLQATVFFGSHWFNMILAFTGPVFSVINIGVYFQHGNVVWGVASTIFVALAWLAQFAISFKSMQACAGWSDITLQSQTLKAGEAWLCGHFYHAVALLQFMPAMYHLDNWMVGVEALARGGLSAVRSIAAEEPSKHTAYAQLLSAMFEKGPNLILTIYIVMNYQIAGKYRNFEFSTWWLVWQVVVIGNSAISVGSSLITLATLGLKNDPLQKILVFLAAWFDVSVHILTIALLVAAYQRTGSIIVGGWFVLKACILWFVRRGDPSGRFRNTITATLLCCFSTVAAVFVPTSTLGSVRPLSVDDEVIDENSDTLDSEDSNMPQNTQALRALFFVDLLLVPIVYFFNWTCEMSQTMHVWGYKSPLSRPFLPRGEGLFRNGVCYEDMIFNCMPLTLLRIFDFVFFSALVCLCYD